MIVAIDYDDTYTRDPIAWNYVCELFMERGHTVYCVTARNKRHMDEVEFTIGRLIGASNCIPTDGNPKRSFVYDIDIIPDVWIDDAPESIVDIKLLGE